MLPNQPGHIQKTLETTGNQPVGEKRNLRLLIGLIAVFGVCLTFMLGQWQLSRGEQKLHMQALLESQMNLQPLSEKDLLGLTDTHELQNRRIQLNGQWLGELNIYLANRTLGGKSGFWVMTPLRLENNETVMVERGWAAWNPINPSEKPVNVQTPPGRVNIEALVVAPPSKMLELWSTSSQVAGSSNPQTNEEPTYLRSAIWQNFDLNLFESQTGIKISAVVHQMGEPSDGLIRQLPAQGISADRNFGYAVQWFLLSALIAVLYLWFQWIKPRIHAR